MTDNAPKTVLMIDPPSGWMFGFPKPIPKAAASPPHLEDWMIENGYPEALILDGMLQYCRFWTKEVDDPC